MRPSRWISRGYGSPLRRPTVDLWVGGPRADGRGLPAVCGGVGPAQATIVSSTADPGPSGNVRFLQRTNHNTWSPSTPIFAPKQAGDLFGVGGRRWTGSGWSYFDEAGRPLGTVQWLGTLPGGLGPSTSVTETIRKYTTFTGRTVSDAPGGVVQSYCQRCDVEAGQTGGGWPATPVENWPLASGDQVVWDTLLEFPPSDTDFIYAPRFGIYNGSSFLYDRYTYSYSGATKQFSPSPPSNPNGATWHGVAVEYGAGPNGGRLWRFVTSCVVPAAVASGIAYAYLLNSSATGSPARTVYIHNHVAYRLTENQGRINYIPPFVMVGNGATPSLSAEDITANGALTNTTLVARIDSTNRPLNFKDSRLFAAKGNQTHYTPMTIDSNKILTYPPYYEYGTVTANIETLAISIDVSRMQQPYKNGAALTAPPSPWDECPAFTAWRFTLEQPGSSHTIVPVRRLQIYPRVLTAAEHAALHAALVAAET